MITDLHKEIRGWILRALHIQHPESLSERNIYLTIRGFILEVTEKAISSEMRYLRDRGYVKSELKKVQSLQVEMWLHVITSDGIDIMEGTKTDPGIQVPGV